MSTDAFDKVSGIIGDAMNDAWRKIISDLAEVAKGAKAPSGLNATASSLSVDEIKGFFAVAGGANLSIAFPAVLPKQPVGLFHAAVIDHGIQSVLEKSAAPGPKRVSGSISIGIGISF